jgi:hypothetical protein
MDEGEALSVSLTAAKTRKKVLQSGRPQWACIICQMKKKAEKTYCRGRYSSRRKIQRVIRLRTKLTDLPETLEP